MASDSRGGWLRISQAALVGADRQPNPEVDDSHSPAASLVLAVGDGQPARRLLLQAAIYSPCRRAGRQPLSIALRDLPESAPDETLPCCRHAAADDLARMLAGDFPQALPLWLEAVG